MTPPSLFEIGSTPEGMTSHSWQDRMKEELLRDASYQQQSIVKRVSEVCNDLEARCDDAERPYREELARSRALEIKLEASEDHVAGFQNQIKGYSQDIDELEAEKTQLKEQVDTAGQRMQDISTKIEELKQALEDTKSEAIRTKAAMSENAKAQDIIYMATLTSKDKELDCKELKVRLLVMCFVEHAIQTMDDAQ